MRLRVLMCLLPVAGLYLPMSTWPDEDWSIQAGPVAFDVNDLQQVTGTFEVRAPAGTPPDAAPRWGGACLMADLIDQGIGLKRCVTHADCNGPAAIDKDRDPRLENFHGYCLKREEDAAYRCWTRPGPPATHCLRSVDGFRLTAGLHGIGPVAADPLGRGAPLPEWVVLACLADADHPRACGSDRDGRPQMSLSPSNPKQHGRTSE